jgi:manganese/zinc/iron transport system ATP- binding protein
MKNISHIPAVSVSDLAVSYGENLILSDCSVTIPQGVMLGIIGPNGAGKTTFIKSILELIPKKNGNIFLLGKTLGYVRNKIAYVAQRHSVDWDFPVTVFDMVLMGCYGKLGWFRKPGVKEQIQVYETLVEVGLTDYANEPIGVLSGGQQQRAFIARALMQNPDIYFLDEPFAGVDLPTEKIIIGLFKKLRDQGKTIIVVHHDMLTASLYFDWALLMNKKIIGCGPIEEILTQQNFAQVYGNNCTFSGLSTLNPFFDKTRFSSSARPECFCLQKCIEGCNKIKNKSSEANMSNLD